MRCVRHQPGRHSPLTSICARRSLSDEMITLAQHVARTLIERVGEVYPDNTYNASHIALMVFYRGVLEGHCRTQGELN